MITQWRSNVAFLRTKGKTLASVMLFASTLALSGCEKPPLAQQRSQYLAQSNGDVVIGVAWPLKSSKASMLDGVHLALDEINQKGGVVGGRKLKLLVRDDEASLTKGRLMAQEIANNPEVAAVIGHLNSYIAEPASQIYEHAGIVMITPGASGQRITENGRNFVFRSLPGNREQGKQIAEYALAQGYKNIAMYYIKNDYGIDLANFFEQKANEVGLTIVDRRSYTMGGDNYVNVLGDWASFLKFDAICLIGSLPESAQIIREAREAGITVPIFGGAGLDSMQLIKLGGKMVEGTTVFSLFNVDDPREGVVQFRQNYLKKFNKLPDSSAAQGYDALHILAQAMNKANTVEPSKVATALRSTRNWQGVTGMHSFDAKGDMAGKRLFQVQVKDGKFVAQ